VQKRKVGKPARIILVAVVYSMCVHTVVVCTAVHTSVDLRAGCCTAVCVVNVFALPLAAQVLRIVCSTCGTRQNYVKSGGSSVIFRYKNYARVSLECKRLIKELFTIENTV
jgi:hypothetical protein